MFLTAIRNQHATPMGLAIFYAGHSINIAPLRGYREATFPTPEACNVYSTAPIKPSKRRRRGMFFTVVGNQHATPMGLV